MRILPPDHQLSGTNPRVSIPFALTFGYGHLDEYQKHEEQKHLPGHRVL